jgi:hypothetical protein
MPLPGFAGYRPGIASRHPAGDGAKTALPSSQDDHPHVQRPIRRRVPQRPLLDPERFPWPSPSIHRLGTLYPRHRRESVTTLAQASLTLQTARSLHPASHPASRPRTGASLQGPRRLPGPDSHRQAALNLSLLRHSVLLVFMAPEQSRRTHGIRHSALTSSCSRFAPVGVCWSKRSRLILAVARAKRAK